MNDQPTCAKCGGVMTPADSRIHPEWFLHDACLPEEVRTCGQAIVHALPAGVGDLQHRQLWQELAEWRRRAETAERKLMSVRQSLLKTANMYVIEGTDEPGPLGYNTWGWRQIAASLRTIAAELANTEENRCDFPAARPTSSGPVSG